MDFVNQIPEDVTEFSLSTVGVPLDWEAVSHSILMGAKFEKSSIGSVEYEVQRRMAPSVLKLMVLHKLLWLIRRTRLRSAYDTKGEVNKQGLYIDDVPKRLEFWEEKPLWLNILCAFSEKYAVSLNKVRFWVSYVFSRQAYGSPYFVFVAGSDGASWVDISYTTEGPRDTPFQPKPTILEADTALCICGNVARSRCSACKEQFYCSKRCQHTHWKQHKQVCGSRQPVQSLAVVSCIEQCLRKKFAWSESDLESLAIGLASLHCYVRTKLGKEGVFSEIDGSQLKGTSTKDLNRVIRFMNGNSRDKTLYIGLTKVGGGDWEKNAWILHDNGAILDVNFPSTSGRVQYFGYSYDWLFAKPFVDVLMNEDGIVIANTEMVQECLDSLYSLRESNRPFHIHNAIPCMHAVYLKYSRV